MMIGLSRTALATISVLSAAICLAGCGEAQDSGSQEDAMRHQDTSAPAPTGAKAETEPGMLAPQLAARYESYLASADEEKKAIYREGIEAVAESGVLERATGVGDTAPAFTLPNHDGEPIALESLLDEGPVVLVWYRGGWCPYCNLTLRAYHEALPRIQGAGATLVAISPELPDNTKETVASNGLDFIVLSDVNNTVAESYGVVFTLTPEVHEIYNNAFGLDEHNGDPSGKLPLAATYVIDREGIVRYAFLDADYTKRAEPADVLAALESLD